jgi:hypothetical protein
MELSDTKKPRQDCLTGLFTFFNQVSGNRFDGNELAVFRTLNFKLHPASGGGEDGVITAKAGIHAGMELGATLTHDDFTGVDQLAAKALDAKAFTF